MQSSEERAAEIVRQIASVEAAVAALEHASAADRMAAQSVTALDGALGVLLDRLRRLVHLAETLPPAERGPMADELDRLSTRIDAIELPPPQNR